MHACFGALRLISSAWYTSKHAMTFVYIYRCNLLSQAHVVQYGRSAHPDMRRVSWDQSGQTTTGEVSFALLLMDTQLTPQSALQHRSEGA